MLMSTVMQKKVLKQLAKGRGIVSKQFSSRSNQIGWLKLSTEYKNYTLSHPNMKLKTVLNKDELNRGLGELCYQMIELSRI
ncbi:MAG: hypothetical protein ACI9UT_002393 [Flavobacteriales bacterium]|jgi:hypothetical protein